MSGRPHLSLRLSSIVRAASEQPELRHIDASRILFVAGAARKDAKASVRPLTYGADRYDSPEGRWRKPKITVDGTPMLYEVCLRPRFFLDATPAERLRTLVHELWHIDPKFDGTLSEARRHRAGADFSGEILGITGRLDVSEIPESGEWLLTAWLRRPPSRIDAHSDERSVYDERDLFDAIVTFG